MSPEPGESESRAQDAQPDEPVSAAGGEEPAGAEATTDAPAPPAGEPDAEAAAAEPGEQVTGGEDDAGAGRVRALDFSQPTKFTTELRRRISRALDPFHDALGAWLAGELRADVEVSLLDISQHTWAAARAKLPADSVAVAVEAPAIERNMLLSLELPFVLQALECLLGGKAAQAPGERHLTEIDWVLTRGVLDSIVSQLSTAWDEFGGPRLMRGHTPTDSTASWTRS